MKSSTKNPATPKWRKNKAQGKTASADAALGPKPASASSPEGAKENANLPFGWKKVRLGDAFKVLGGGTPSTSRAEFWKGKIPWITSADIDDHHRISPRRWITEQAIKESATNFVPKGSVIVVTRVGLGKVAECFTDLCFSQDSQGLIFDPKEINPRFVVHQLSKTVQVFRHISRGTTINGVTKKQLLDLEFLLPPLDDQRRIVAEIEKQFTRLDAGVAALKRVQANLKRYRAAVLKAACEGPWKWKPLAEIAEIQGGIQKQPKRRPVKNDYPFLRVANVLRGRLDLSEVHRIELFGQELNRLRLQPGDLLIVEGNGSLSEIGRMAIWNGEIEDCVHQNHIIRARLAEDVLPKFASIYWNSPDGQRRITEVASSTSGLYTLSVRKVGRLELPVPSLAEQRRIVAQVEQRLSVVDEQEAVASANLHRADRLRQAILKHALEGNIAPEVSINNPVSFSLQRTDISKDNPKGTVQE